MNVVGKNFRKSDLTGFAALLGESFSARIDLLAQIIQGAHYPSLGTYKERILAETIRNYLPRSLEVGTGFVLFPHEEDAPHEYFDPLNQSAFTISKQCDILVYDADVYPPVFRDKDFVVLRPEAVKAVIEVKGSLNISEVNGIIDNFIDFGRKWKTTQDFYKSHHIQGKTESPMLLAMGWSVYQSKGRAVTNPSKIRKAISRRYGESVSADELDNFPLLHSLMIYNEAVINLCSFPTGVGGDNDFSMMGLGWYSQDGRFSRIGSTGELYRDKDRTVAWMLAQLHLTLGLDNFNRLFSYLDEAKSGKRLPFPHDGHDLAWMDVGKIE